MAEVTVDLSALAEGWASVCCISFYSSLRPQRREAPPRRLLSDWERSREEDALSVRAGKWMKKGCGRVGSQHVSVPLTPASRVMIRNYQPPATCSSRRLEYFWKFALKI